MTTQTTYRKINQEFQLVKTDLHKELGEYEIHSDQNSIPICWEGAKGFQVFDADGNTWIDFTSGIFVANTGHSNVRIGNALQNAWNEGRVFCYNYASEIRLRYDKTLIASSPDHFKKVAHVSSGTEAVFGAYKIMKNYGNKTNRKYIVCFKGNYHGRGLANDFFGGDGNKSAWAGFKDENVIVLDFPYDSETGKFDPSLLPPGGEISGFLLETFQGWGAWFYPDDFLTDLTRFTEENQILVCFDEMQSGFFRTGPMYGYQSYNVKMKPDLLCLGKGISSSLPYSALVISERAAPYAENLHIQGTHAGNLTALVASQENLEIMLEDSFQQLLRKNIEVFEGYCRKISSLPAVETINFRGMIAGIIVKDKATADHIVHEAIYNGVLPVCTNREAIKLGPPLNIETAALEEGMEVLYQIISAC